MARPLTDEEKEKFGAIRDAENIALVQCSFEDQDVAVICAITEKNDDRLIWPLALMIPEWMEDGLRGPDGEVLGNEAS